jgi:HK97 family phage prohead protease
MEHRFISEIRAEGRRLEGYAATFNSEARIADFTETILPGAFADSLDGDRDILALVDHDSTKLLARTKTGSLELREDDHGLAFGLSLPDTQAGRDVLELAKRGDLGGMSFGFTVPKGGERWQGRRRELVDIDLREISVVSAWPAYDGTSVTARAKTPKLNVARRFLESCEWEY